ncbi:MAG TPA: hypothetical protein VHM24_10695 [Gemmatimonadaceae bacterium]|nr:hypothetical protein [Gemmatimonadaceae bacterium]
MTNRLELRRGMSIMELVVGMVILAIIGMALTRIMVSQARYFDHQKTANRARNVSRGPLNRVVSDLRMVEAQGGIEAASATSVTARVPFAIGLVCVTNSNGTQISLLPVDSAMYAAPGYSGYAWRDGQGQYHYRMAGSFKDDNAGDLAACTASGVATLTANKGKVVRVTPKMSDTASIGTPVFLVRIIKYEFKPSVAIPGSVGLFRTVVSTGTEEELSGPYANDAKFRFYVGSSTSPQAAPPADLSRLRGLELNMTGLSETTPRGAIERQKAPFVTAVFFKNRLN